MRYRHYYPLFAAALLLAPVAAPAATPGALQALQNPSTPADGGRRGGRGALAGFLTPQQQLMFQRQARDQLKDMPVGQRQAYRREQLQKIIAMSPAERQKFKADLQAQWDGLPPAQKARLQAQLANPPGPPPPPPRAR